MQTIAVIPARYASTRFPGKPLALLAGKPILQHVYERVLETQLFHKVIIATDDERIAEAADKFHGEYRLTSPHHLSGSDRIVEVVRDLDYDVIVNVQGDEPMITAQPLADLLEVFRDENVQVASLMRLLEAADELTNPNIVKVVTDKDANALYFSRSPLPYNRDNLPDIKYFAHVGVYAYRKAALLRFVTLPPGRLEQIEKLEQLRLLENGIPIRMVETVYQGIGIDTPEDLVKVNNLLATP